MACSQTLNGILGDCAASKGGIRKVWIANFDEVDEVTVDATANTITAITMVGSTKFKGYAFRKNTGSMTSTLNVDDANGVNYVSTDLVLQFNKMETAKRLEMAALALAETAIIVEDANGKFWYLGKDEACSSTAGNGQTGTARTDGNFYQITLQSNDDSFPYEVTPAAVEAVTE